CQFVLCYCWRFYFFFQAEDGIRDFHVTGVQTCALPILQPPRLERSLGQVTLADGTSLDADAFVFAPGPWMGTLFPDEAGSLVSRSEERRVGKECRCRWTSYRSKKKHDAEVRRSRAERRA